MKLNEFVCSLEKMGKKNYLTESKNIIWTDVYKIFTDIINVVYPEEEKIIAMVEALYKIEKGNPVWDEAYRRFMDTDDENELE